MASATSFQVEVHGGVGTDGGLGAASAMLGLRQQLQRFGSVVAVEALPSPAAGLLVTYADAWAAASAREAMASQAWASPEKGQEVEALKPCDAGSWLWDGVPTQASLTPYMDEDGFSTQASLAGSVQEASCTGRNHDGLAATGGSDGLCELSPVSSFHDLQSLGETESEEEEEVWGVPASLSKVSCASGPKFLSGLELSQLNWKRLAEGRELRRDLMLRGLPRALCNRGSLEAFLAAKGLRELVSKVRVLPGKGLQPGSATVLATSAEAARRLSRFFHGAQLPGARSPVAVSFAAGRCARRGNLEPMRVPAGVPLPPGLESWTCPF